MSKQALQPFKPNLT